MLAISSPQPNRILVSFAALFCLAIDERGAVTAAILMLLYVLLYWKDAVDWKFKIIVSACLFAYSAVTIKFFLPINFYNAHFLPTTAGELVGRFHDPVFFHNAVIFVIVNCGLWLLAWFDWRAAVIALVAMAPNIVGNIGGAEKVGWTSHYHDEYLPALIWSAMAGYIVAYRKCRNVREYVSVACIPVGLVAYLLLLDPYTGMFSPSNASNSFFAWFPREIQVYTSPAGLQSAAWAHEMQAVVPKGSVVTSIEAGMPYLYSGRTIEWFPVDIEHADYAVLVHVGDTYSGVSDYLGPEQTARVNALIVRRMRKDGYDFANPVLAAPNGVTVLRRVH
jgi:hypothetical protein